MSKINVAFDVEFSDVYIFQLTNSTIIGINQEASAAKKRKPKFGLFIFTDFTRI